MAQTGVDVMFVSLVYSILRSFVCIAAERTQNRNLVKYLLTREKIVETDYPVPSYLANMDGDASSRGRCRRLSYDLCDLASN